MIVKKIVNIIMHEDQRSAVIIRIVILRGDRANELSERVERKVKSIMSLLYLRRAGAHGIRDGVINTEH